MKELNRADIIVIDDQERTIELCRRAMPAHVWHGPARDWEEAQAMLGRLKRKVSMVLLDLHFDIPRERLLGVDEDADERAVKRARRRQGMTSSRPCAGPHRTCRLS